MRTLTLLILFAFLSGMATAQSRLKGTILDDDKKPVQFVSVALLHPADSTLAHFGISNADGYFEIKNVAPGSYLMQAALMGYKTVWRSVNMRAGTDSTIAMILHSSAKSLGEVEVSAERVPIQIKKDTVEYDAGAFKTKPDAAAEDLLKKLPGVEVDRAGNVKAQGENVKKVLVDGKEFFGDDPKTATKNLPADAVKKVQVYDKKSDQSEMTGIDDGERERTINFVLKDNKKSAWLGDVTAGAGTDNHAQASAKVFRFTKVNQLAALGMMNNINRFGFSLGDYLGFSGGLHFMNDDDGGGMLLGGDNSMPVDFGQPVTGLVTSGAAGLNFTHEKTKNHRFNISYMGNGSQKLLDQVGYSRNFTPTSSFTQRDTLDEKNRNDVHRLNFLWRLPDSTQNLKITGSAQWQLGFDRSHNFSALRRGDTLGSRINGFSLDNGQNIAGTLGADYLKKFSGHWRLFRINANAAVSGDLRHSVNDNVTQLFDFPFVSQTRLYRDVEKQRRAGNATARTVRDLGDKFFIEGIARAGETDNAYTRKQRTAPGDQYVIDSLSGDFLTRYRFVQPALALRRNTSKQQVRISAAVEFSQLENHLANELLGTKSYLFFVPAAYWENNYRTGSRMGVYYNSSVNTPSAEQLFPLTDYSNPLQVFRGNPDLRPEQQHQLHLDWSRFDQFSFTSLFVGVNGTYTHDHFNWKRNINAALVQELSLVNVPDDYRAGINAEFSTPIRKLGINFSVSAEESWNRGLNIIDDQTNVNTNLSHELHVSVDNRKKEKVDLTVGGSVKLSDAHYSIRQSLNNRYTSYGGYMEFNWTPNDKWNIGLTADLTNYGSSSFDGSIFVPLVSAECSRYILKNNRGVITLEGFDLLNKNTGLERVSDVNYLLEQQSSIIRRYVLLSFKYRINKFDTRGSGGIQVDVKGR